MSRLKRRNNRDNSAPSVPTLTATPATTSVSLAWTASTDNIGVAGYDLQYSPDGSTWNYLAYATASRTFEHVGLTDGFHYYRVRAFDAARNYSGYSTANAILDAEAPTVPGLTVTGTTSSSISLSWTVSTDNVGVLSYRLERSVDQGSWTQIYEALSPRSYTDSGLPASTLRYYRVSAADAAGNRSAYSFADATTESVSDGWPVQSLSYLPAVRNRALFAQNNRHAFGAGTNPTVYRVNTTNPTAALTLQGDGTYRGGFVPAFQATGPRIIVFETSGLINLGGNFYAANAKDYLWVAGQTAPAPGVTFTNGGLDFNSSNILVQHVRVQNTYSTSSQNYSGRVDGNVTGGRSNLIFDHCDFYFGDTGAPTGGNFLAFSRVGPLDLVECSMVWPIKSGSLGSSTLFYANEAGRKISMQGCLLAHHWDRSPLSDAPYLHFANNVVFDHARSQLRERTGIPTRVNIIGNRYKLCAYAPSNRWLLLAAAGGGENGFGWVSPTDSAYNGSTKLWLEGNYADGSLIADQMSTSVYPSSLENNSNLPASSLKASAIIADATPLGWVGWSDSAALETHVLARVGAYPSNRTTAALQALADYQANTARRLSAVQYHDTSLAVNTQTFNLTAYGQPFDPRSGETTRTNIEAYLLDLGEAA